MHFDGKEYTVTLVDLPCVVESWKTLDRSIFYKSADVHQVRYMTLLPQKTYFDFLPTQ